MKIIYNGFDFSAMGELSITQKREMEGGDQPQRARVQLTVKVDLFERGYDLNHQHIEAMRAAMATPNATLIWRNEDAGADYVNQSATLVSDDLPEEWGEYHQAFTVTFAYYEQQTSGAGNNVPLTFLKEGAGKAIRFDVVNEWEHSSSVDRFSALRKHRRQVTGSINVAGEYLGDTTRTLDERRADLTAKAKEFDAGMDGAEGVLEFGASGSVFQGVVRIEKWTCKLDQMVNKISFSFTCSYTRLPDEADYAIVEMSATEKDNNTGELALTISGRIQAQSETAARTKLNSLLSTVLAQRGYTDGQSQGLDTTPATVEGPDGVTFTELTFSAAYRRWRTTNQKMTFQKTGGKAPVPLGELIHWRDRYSSTRFNEMHSQRRHATGGCEATGTWKADMALTIPQRRAQLLAMQRRMKTEANGADGTLVIGTWTQVLRIDDFTAEINQAETGIDWSFTGSYSLFPNEAGYATVDLTVVQRQSVEDGDEYLSLLGRIASQNGAAARAKLAVVRTALLSTYGWTLAQRLRDDSQLQAVDANGDVTAGLDEKLDPADKSGLAFMELSFSEEYRRRIPGEIVGSTLTVQQRDDVPSQTRLTTYAGTVTATGPTYDAAYGAALKRARELGADREGVIDSTATLRSSVLTTEERQTRAENGREFLRLGFTYEYQGKIAEGMAYIEMTTTTVHDTFGVDTESCSGVVMAREAALAQTLYADVVRAAFSGRLIRNEQTGITEQRMQRGAGWNNQHVRLEFSLQMPLAKARGRVAIKYAMQVQKDWLNLEQRTHVNGSVYAIDGTMADLAWDGLLGGLGLSRPLRESRGEDREFLTDDSTFNQLLKVDREAEYASRLTGSSGVLEMDLSESVTYSGTRYAVQNLPYNADFSGGVSIVQPTGIEPGSRTVSGSVTAGTKAVALAWARKQKALLTGDRRGYQFPQPPREDTAYKFVPRIEGIAAGADANVQVYRVSFTYAEILPLYPAPA